MVLGKDASKVDGPAHTQLTFRSLTENAPGTAWQRVVAHGWPGWREWFTERGGGDLSLAEARRALRRHMPEFETLWDELAEVADAGDTLRRFLGFWCPPRYLVNCSQAVLIDEDGPLLSRNYDLDPALNEATLLTTNWRGTRVIGMVEGMAGLADGMNEHGLAASLTFGGRVEVGKGFGIPLIMRYVLQMCRDVADAIEALRAVPSHMSYNITLADASGSGQPSSSPPTARQWCRSNHGRQIIKSESNGHTMAGSPTHWAAPSTSNNCLPILQPMPEP